MVFEYMDHDLTGLADRPGMRFSVPQIKVFTKKGCLCPFYCSIALLVYENCGGISFRDSAT